MEARRQKLKETFIIVSKELKTQSCHFGICNALKQVRDDGRITHEQYHEAKDYLHSRRPNIFSSFFWHKSYKRLGKWWQFWWRRNVHGKEQRILFLDYLINTI